MNILNKSQRCEKIIEVLESLYPNPKPSLIYSTAYTFLVAVLLSAQCTDERVNKVAPKLYLKADTPEKMVQLSPEIIEGVIRPCGLAPTKSKAIYNLSCQLIDQYKGQVPSSFEELEALPGVGHKTASVVMCQWFDVPAFPVDTHIHRLAKRWKLSKGTSVKQTEKDLKRLFNKKYWINLHLQMIYFGREYCPARVKPNHASNCPICQFC